jgi:hypothetical protein
MNETLRNRLLERERLLEATWDDRLGWAFGLISESADDRAQAHQRLTETREHWVAALRAYNEVLYPRDDALLQVRQDEFSRTHDFTFPQAMWRWRSMPYPQWRGLPYAILYLEWETRYPDEWRNFNDSWGTKTSILRDLAHCADELPAATRRQLADTVVRVARRDYHCEDVGYARLARRLDSPTLRQELTALSQEPATTGRRHALYLLWLLDHPELPHPQTKQWHHWLAHHLDTPSAAGPAPD